MKGKIASQGKVQIVIESDRCRPHATHTFSPLARLLTERTAHRLYEVQKSQGVQPNQQVTFLSDGGDTVRDLQSYLNPNEEHLLDWFHITMRRTVMRQMAKGLGPPGFEPREIVVKQLERIKWFLWHGNVFRALETVDWLSMDIDVESTINQVVNKRMVKKQQKRWSRKGSHLLLQIRTRVLNDELREIFQQWYPRFVRQELPLKKAAKDPQFFPLSKRHMIISDVDVN